MYYIANQSTNRVYLVHNVHGVGSVSSHFLKYGCIILYVVCGKQQIGTAIYLNAPLDTTGHWCLPAEDWLHPALTTWVPLGDIQDHGDVLVCMYASSYFACSTTRLKVCRRSRSRISVVCRSDVVCRRKCRKYFVNLYFVLNSVHPAGLLTTTAAHRLSPLKNYWRRMALTFWK